MGSGPIWKLRVALARLRKRCTPLRRLHDRDLHPVFLTGISGSGTTLLSALLHQDYANAAFLDESPFRCAPGSLLHLEKVATFDSLEGYRNALVFDEKVTAHDVWRETMRCYRREIRYPKESNIVLDKAPSSHMLRAPLLGAAFPASGFVIVLREPIPSIEGLRRKWGLFGRTDLHELGEFWMELHRSFSAWAHGSENDVLAVTYRDLVERTDATTSWVARRLGLTPRPSPTRLEDRPDQPGKGLRNVVEGRIRVVDGDLPREDFSLGEADVEWLSENLTPFYDEIRTELGAGADSIH